MPTGVNITPVIFFFFWQQYSQEVKLTMKDFRIKSVLVIFCVLTGLVCINVFNISMIKHAHLSTMASNQRKQTEAIGSYRGCIYDKNMIPLANALMLSGDEDYDTAFEKRYSFSSVCRHTVGYAFAGGEGICGLEKTFDSELKDGSTLNITHTKDPFGNLLSDKPVAIENASYIPKSNLKTTIDYKIQKIAEEAADKHIERGAIVIIDIENFDVAAMVSRPNFDQSDIKSCLGSEGSPLMNKAICAYNAGSIFKTITAAAMLSCGTGSDATFECAGVYNADGKDFLCNKKDGHGLINFKTAYAKSCNSFFYSGGIEVSGKAIYDAAKKFSLGKKLLNCDIGESEGIVSQRDVYTKRECANMSIGQGEILVTPLQAANIVAIVANAGVAKRINLADSIVDERGAVIKNLRLEGSERIISKEDALILADMMREAVLEGTAQAVQNGIVAVAGKTGSAQTGWIENGETMTHGWFCAFFPYENPKYAMAVFAENGKNGSSSCIPPFREIVLKINELY